MPRRRWTSPTSPGKGEALSSSSRVRSAAVYSGGSSGSAGAGGGGAVSFRSARPSFTSASKAAAVRSGSQRRVWAAARGSKTPERRSRKRYKGPRPRCRTRRAGWRHLPTGTGSSRDIRACPPCCASSPAVGPINQILSYHKIRGGGSGGVQKYFPGRDRQNRISSGKIHNIRLFTWSLVCYTIDKSEHPHIRVDITILQRRREGAP